MTADQAAGVVGQLRDSLDRIVRTDIDTQLVRAEELGAANFRAHQPLFERIMSFCKRLQSLDWTLIPPELVAQVLQRSENLANSLVEASQLSLDKENPTQQRDQIAERISSNFDALRQTAIPLVGFLSWETIDLTATREALTNLLDEANQKVTASLEQATKQIEQQRTQAEEIVQAIRTASAEAGVGVHHELFGQAAVKHEKTATRCLAAALLLGLGTVLGAIALVLAWEVNGNISEASVLQLVVAKAVVLAVGFYATTAAVRMYRAQLHLAVVNRHRETSLQTFQAFVKATDDLDTKNKVLLETTHAIFGQVATGMVDTGDGSGVLQILDGVSGLFVRRTN